MKINKFTKLMFIVVMILLTFQSASAIDLQFNATNDPNRWIRLNSNLFATYDPGVPDTINYYSSAGLVKSIDISPYTASRALKFGEKNADNQQDIIFTCNYVDEELCVVDYSGNDVDIENMSFVEQHMKDTFGAGGTYYGDIEAVTDDLMFWSYQGGWTFVTNRNMDDIVISIQAPDFRRINSSDSGSQLEYCLKPDESFGTPNYDCPHVEYIQLGGEWIIHWAYTVTSLNPNEVHSRRIVTTLGGTGIAYDNVTHGILKTDYDAGSKTADHCLATNNFDILCNLNSGINALLFESDNDVTDYPNPGSTFNGDNVEIYWLDDNRVNHEVIINGTQSEIIVYESGVRQNPGANMTSYYSKYAYSLAGDVVIYPIGTSTYRLTNNFTAPSPIIDNETEPFFNITIEANVTYDEELFSLELLGGDEVLIGQLDGGDQYLYIYDYSTPTSKSVVDNAEVSSLFLNEIYKTSTSSQTVFVGTDDGIFVYDLATLNEQYHTRWGLFPGINDDAYDIEWLNDTTAMACDNNDEADYYTLGVKPTTNTGGGCYDIEVGGTLMYVDSDTAGIRIYNLTDPTNPNIITTFNNRADSIGVSHGDLLSIDPVAGLLLFKKSDEEFTVIDLTSPSSPTELVTCDNGGAGTITSFEIINQDIAVAGMEGGRISVCDLTNSDQETNTVWYDLEGMNGENIQAVEYDGTYLHAIGNSTYVISSFAVDTINISGNTPPTIDNYTISDTELLLGQEIDIAIIAGNVEPLDVIHYRLRCEDNESYQENTNGEFSCSYGIQGTKTITMEVSDNYHTGSWYYTTTAEIEVLGFNFTGGTLRILVLDEDSIAIDNAYITLDDNQTGYTNIYGSITFTTTTTGLQEVTAQKTGYYDRVESLYADGTTYPIILTSIGTGEGETALIVNVVDSTGEAVYNALVSYTNTLTYTYDYGFTDLNGRIIFVDIPVGTTVIGASKDDYKSETDPIGIGANTTTEITVTLTLEVIPIVYHEDRDCRDRGLWLCGDVQTACLYDSDCLSDQCTSGINTCSKFNWTQCDDNDRPRNTGCIVNRTISTGIDSLIDWFFRNLLIVIVLIIIAGAVGFLAHSLSKN